MEKLENSGKNGKFWKKWKIIRSECKVCLHGNVKCMKKMGTRDLPHVPIHKM